MSDVMFYLLSCAVVAGFGIGLSCCCCDTVCTDIFGLGGGTPIKVVIPSGPHAGTYETGTVAPGCIWSTESISTPEYNFDSGDSGDTPCEAQGQYVVTISSTGSGSSIVWTVLVELQVHWSGVNPVCNTLSVFSAQSWSDTFDCSLPRVATDIGNPSDPSGPATVQIKPL